MTESVLATQLHRRLWGLAQTQLIFVAAQLDIAEHVAGGPRSVAELAAATGSLESKLYRILRGLATMGIFRESAPRVFEATPMADLLRAGHPNSMRALALMVGSPWHVTSWANIIEAVKSDGPAFEHVMGVPLFEYFDRQPEAGATFDGAMTFTSQRQAAAVCDAYDFSSTRSIVDVAGGQGDLIAAILERHPHAVGTLFERPPVAAGISRMLRVRGLESRCSVVHGDLFKQVPPTGDTLILKRIIHDWDDANAVTILGNCRRALQTRGRVLVIDAVIEEFQADFMTAAADVEMMVLLRGRERTVAEFEELFARVGLALVRAIPTRAGLHILETIAT